MSRGCLLIPDALFLAVAVMPPPLARALGRSFDRTRQRVRAGSRGPYINASTDRERFFLYLRLGAVLNTALFVVLAIASPASR